jgi:hypothetical protein
MPVRWLWLWRLRLLQIARLSFNTQIEYFKDTLQELSVLLGPGPALADYLSKSLFGIVFGSNDYLNNYLINSTGFSRQFTPDEYRLYVAQAFSKQLLVTVSAFLQQTLGKP